MRLSTFISLLFLIASSAEAQPFWIYPNSGYPGQDMQIRVIGYKSEFTRAKTDTNIVIDGQGAFFTHSSKIISDTELLANIHVYDSANIGWYDADIACYDSGYNYGVFEVAAFKVISKPPPPSVILISPPVAIAGDTTELTLTSNTARFEAYSKEDIMIDFALEGVSIYRVHPDSISSNTKLMLRFAPFIAGNYSVSVAIRDTTRFVTATFMITQRASVDPLLLRNTFGVFPNPARSSSPTVFFSLAEPSPTTFCIIDEKGAIVCSTFLGKLSVGAHTLPCNVLRSGTYWYELITPKVVRSGRFVIER